MKKTLLSLLAAVLCASAVVAQPGGMDWNSLPSHDFQVNLKKVGAPIQPTMYGIFFEDINYGADGGLYAELVKNRSFDFPYAFTGWQVAGNVELRQGDGPFDRNPNYVRLGYSGHHDKFTALTNEGFFGIGVEQGKTYNFSVWARVPVGFKTAKVRVQLAIPNTMGERQQFVEKEITFEGSVWKKYEVAIESPITHPKAQLRLFLVGKNSVDLEHVSLFPADAWRGILRNDLVQALADPTVTT